MNQSAIKYIKPKIGITIVGRGSIKKDWIKNNPLKTVQESPWQHEMLNGLYREILGTHELARKKIEGVCKIDGEYFPDGVFAELSYRLRIYRDEFFTSTIEIKPEKIEWEARPLLDFVDGLITEKMKIMSGLDGQCTIKEFSEHITKGPLEKIQVLGDYSFIIVEDIDPKPEIEPERFATPEFYSVGVRRIREIENINPEIFKESQMNVSVFKHDLVYYNFHNAFFYCKRNQEVLFYHYIYEVFKLISFVLRYCDLELNRMMIQLGFGNKMKKRVKKIFLSRMEELWLENMVSVECYKALATVASFRAERAVERANDVLGAKKLQENLDSKLDNITHLIGARQARSVQIQQRTFSVLYYLLAFAISLCALILALK